MVQQPAFAVQAGAVDTQGTVCGAGLLGGFTTFSAFAGETLVLAQQRPAAAALNVGLNMVLCLAAVWVGAKLAG